MYIISLLKNNKFILIFISFLITALPVLQISSLETLVKRSCTKRLSKRVVSKLLHSKVKLLNLINKNKKQFDESEIAQQLKWLSRKTNNLYIHSKPFAYAIITMIPFLIVLFSRNNKHLESLFLGFVLIHIVFLFKAISLAEELKQHALNNQSLEDFCNENFVMDLNGSTIFGFCVLITACRLNHVENIKFLLKQKNVILDVSQWDEGLGLDMTPLDYAAKNNNSEIVKTLLNKLDLNKYEIERQFIKAILFIAIPF